MVKKRVYVVLLIILFVFFIVMFSLFGIKNIKQERDTAVIVIDNSSVWKYSGRKFLNIRYKSSFQKLSWKKFRVFSNNKELGEYYLWYNDGWYVFDDEKNPITTEGNLFAYSANYDLKLKKFETENVDNMEYVNYVLEDNDLSLSSEFTSLYKVSMDFDNDSNVEEFYLISNAFAMDFTPSNTFSIAFMVKDNKIYDIYKDISNNKNFNGCKPYYSSFLDIDEDGIYEFILSCSAYSVSDRTDMLYQFSEDGFKILISNK